MSVKNNSKKDRRSGVDRRKGERRWMGSTFPVRHERRQGERRLGDRRKRKSVVEKITEIFKKKEGR